MVQFLLELLQKTGGIAPIHLYMMELEGDGQCRLEPALAIAAPHHHRVAEQIGILIDNAVQFGRHHGRSAYHHRIGQEYALAGPRHLTRQSMVVVHELIQILREGDVARVDAPLPVIHDDIDGQPVITIEGTLFRQEIEQLLLTGRLADAPAEQGIEGEVSPFAPLQQPAHIECLGQGDHRHGGFHPQVESGSTRSLFRINCYFHLCLICFYVYTVRFEGPLPTVLPSHESGPDADECVPYNLRSSVEARI